VSVVPRFPTTDEEVRNTYGIADPSASMLGQLADAYASLRWQLDAALSPSLAGVRKELGRDDGRIIVLIVHSDGLPDARGMRSGAPWVGLPSGELVPPEVLRARAAASGNESLIFTCYGSDFDINSSIRLSDAARAARVCAERFAGKSAIQPSEFVQTVRAELDHIRVSRKATVGLIYVTSAEAGALTVVRLVRRPSPGAATFSESAPATGTK